MILPVFLWAALAACGSAGEYTYHFDKLSNVHLITGMPFFHQKAFQCGPATLAAVLNYYGETLATEKIADAVFREKLRATTTLDMLLYPRQIGYASEYYEGSVTDLKEAVKNKVPLIVMVDYGLGPVSKYHFLVVAGYSSEGVIPNSEKLENSVVPWNIFINQWGKTHNWTLRIQPRQGPCEE